MNQVKLSPEHYAFERIHLLTTRIKDMGLPCLNMTFHSTSLFAGLSPYVVHPADEDRFLRQIEEFLVLAVRSGWTPAFLREVEEIVAGEG